jgi:hypothetical protein
MLSEKEINGNLELGTGNLKPVPVYLFFKRSEKGKAIEIPKRK